MLKSFGIASGTCAAGLLCSLVILSGCNRNPTAAEKTYPTATPAEVGDLVYSVAGQQWLSSLEGQHGPRVPTHRFLVVTLSITNKKPDRLTVPLVTLLDGAGKTYLELDNGEGVANWLGVFRHVEPNGSEGGMILFDAPSDKGPYKIRVSSGGDVDKEVTALIEVPDEKATQSAVPVAPEQ